MITIVVIHLGLTVASEHNAPDETPAGILILPSPIGYFPSCGALQQTPETYFYIFAPLAARRACEPTDKSDWAASRETDDSLLPMRALRSDMHYENTDQMIPIVTKEMTMMMMMPKMVMKMMMMMMMMND